MSVVAWDGKTLAADKKAVHGEMCFPVTKIKRNGDKDIFAWTGGMDYGLALMDWYVNGADKSKWPEFQKTDDWTRLIVVKVGNIVQCDACFGVGSRSTSVFFFERVPYPLIPDSLCCAWGSGAEYAMAAMAMGADARKAVEIAGRFSITCGLGVDAFDV